jgi:hypothetical protein
MNPQAHRDNSLDFGCPVCRALPGETCELNSGGPRFQSHRERLDIAIDAEAGLPPEPTKRAKISKKLAKK